MNKGGIESVCITAVFEYCVSLVVAECGGAIWGDLRHPPKTAIIPLNTPHTQLKRFQHASILTPRDLEGLSAISPKRRPNETPVIPGT